MAKNNGTQAVTRAIQLLKLFDDDNPYWALSDIADAAELNKTTAHRILNAMEAEGLIQRNEHNEYQLGSELIALGGRATRTNNLRRISRDYLRQLSDDTGETVTLEILREESDGRWVTLVIDEVLGRYLVGITQYIGSRLPVHATSTGKSILAFHDVAFVESVLTQPLVEFTSKTQISVTHFQDELNDIRERGYALVNSELEDGLIAVGVPIFNTDGHVIAAVSVVGPSVRLKPEHMPLLAEKAQTVAREISFQLGFRP